MAQENIPEVPVTEDRGRVRTQLVRKRHQRRSSVPRSCSTSFLPPINAGWYAYVLKSKPKQNGRHFADDIFKWIFLIENIGILIQISPEVVLVALIANKWAKYYSGSRRPYLTKGVVFMWIEICIEHILWSIVTTKFMCVVANTLKWFSVKDVPMNNFEILNIQAC